MAQRFDYQFAKTDTLASTLAAAATSGTLSTGNFTNFTADYLVVDYDVPSKREIIKCSVTGTALSSITRGIDGTSDVEHTAGAKVGYMWLPVHADHVSTAAEDGWVDASKYTWVYASASTFTIAGVDLTTTFQKGTKLRFKQGAGYKYAVVASSSFSTNTTVTIIVNTDYTIANAAITDNYYSYTEKPAAFPTKFSWTPSTVGWAATPTTTECHYYVIGTIVHVYVEITGTSNATNATFTLPTAADKSLFIVWGRGVDNGSGLVAPIAITTAAGSATATAYSTLNSAGWTGSGTKTVISQFWYEMDV